MEEKTALTLERIKEAALTEFLDKGYLGASLRQIVKNAGVTTGAFLRLFFQQGCAFAAIVEPHAAEIMGRFVNTQIAFAELPGSQNSRRTWARSRRIMWIGWWIIFAVIARR